MTNGLENVKLPKTDDRNRQSLRLDADLCAAIDAARAMRAGTISRNTWITEAILEKIERDRSGQAKIRIGSGADV